MEIEMTIKGLMIDPITNMPIIVLRDEEGQRILPIWVGVFEANAIALQIENVQTPRPMTHDLLRTSSTTWRRRSSASWSATCKENTFYATIHLRRRTGRSRDRRPPVRRDRPRAAHAVADLRGGGRDPERAQRSRRARRPMDVGRLQKWLEGLSDDELGKYKM